MSYRKIKLNGTWMLQPAGAKPQNFEYRVPVPAMVDNCTPLLDWQNHDYFWYKTEFNIEAAANQENIYLQLEQVQFGAEVWLNDKKVGFDIPCYTSQWYELTPYINKSGSNILLVRVGQKTALPGHSAAGNDEERLAWLPGIWGDVFLHYFGFARIEYVQIIPDINEAGIEVICEIENFSKRALKVRLSWQLFEKESDRPVSKSINEEIKLDSKSKYFHQFRLKLPDFTLWSPANPFLYLLKISLDPAERRNAHNLSVPFGMRKFEIKEGRFFLNNQRKALLGSNIAFHRLLNDSTRETLLWDEQWIKKALIDIPKEHNLTFFRFHLGHAYNRWYDLADTHGILLEDEWSFWKSSGTPEQIEREFTAWLKENFNRPSIIIWNALNESSDRNITEDIIPRLKKLDPTRPWQHVDFKEDHPYIYSLGPVLNGKKFGFTRSIFDLQKSSTPAMVNEFEWWWLDRDNRPSLLTQIVVERWLGRNPGQQMLIEHQAFLAAELGELWRRFDLDAIMPFVYLSVGEGPTAHWFNGPLRDLKPKKVLAAFKNTFSPLGISIELWDRHFVCGETREIYIYLFNDTDMQQEGKVYVYNKQQQDMPFTEQVFSLPAAAHEKITFTWKIPHKAGSFNLKAEIFCDGKSVAWSEKTVHLFKDITPPQKKPVIAVDDPSGEMLQILKDNNVIHGKVENLTDDYETVLMNGQAFRRTDQVRRKLSGFVARGGILILQEPEYAVTEEKHFFVLDDLKLKIIPQDDSIMGGYNSYVFIEDEQHPLWYKIKPDFLKMFNGALGGELVSAHDVFPGRDFKSLARCGLSLAMPAVMEIGYGKGKVIISRIQLRGRLRPQNKPGGLYDRRYDPVAEQFFWNLLSCK